MDNRRQFIDQKLESFLAEIGIKHITSFVEHPQTNGQAEAANKVILAQLKKRLGTAKGKWVDELSERFVGVQMHSANIDKGVPI